MNHHLNKPRSTLFVQTRTTSRILISDFVHYLLLLLIWRRHIKDKSKTPNHLFGEDLVTGLTLVEMKRSSRQHFGCALGHQSCCNESSFEHHYYSHHLFYLSLDLQFSASFHLNCLFRLWLLWWMCRTDRHYDGFEEDRLWQQEGIWVISVARLTENPFVYGAASVYGCSGPFVIITVREELCYNSKDVL